MTNVVNKGKTQDAARLMSRKMASTNWWVCLAWSPYFVTSLQYKHKQCKYNHKQKCKHKYCQAIFEGLGFSQLANSDERKLRQPRPVALSIFSSVLAELSSGVLVQLMWRSETRQYGPLFQIDCPCDLARPRLRRRTFGQIQKTWGSVHPAALLDVVCPDHSRWKTEREDEA